MRFRRGIGLVLIATGLLCPLGCEWGEAENEAAVGVTPSATSEGGLSIAPEAQASIGLATRSVHRQRVRERIETAGWLMARPGSDVVIKAAATGFVLPSVAGDGIALGTKVDKNQPLGQLQVFLSPVEEAQVVALKEDADTRMRQSQVSLKIAEDRYGQVKDLQGGAIASKDVQSILEALERSRAAYEEARDQMPFLPREPYERPLQLSAVPITSPDSGVITQLHVRPRQLVVQGDPLWTVSDWTVLWVRVPVFEGDLPRILADQPVDVTVAEGETPLQAVPTGIPQPTREGQRAVDLLYQLKNSDGRLRPGQAVSVSLPSGTTADRMVLPRSAIVWDMMGNAWVYCAPEENLFVRRRVWLGASLQDEVVVERGLNEGDRVVSVGAETLFGEEFKSQIPAEEDDD